MKTTLINSLCQILFWLLLSIQVNAEVSIFKPKLDKNLNHTGSSLWTAICAGIGYFKQYDATINRVGNLNSYNEFILELYNCYSYFTNSVELARSNGQNINSAKSFDIVYSQFQKNT